MTLRKLPAAFAAASLVVAPVAVQAAPVATERATASAEETSEMRGRSRIGNGIIIALLAAAGMLFLILTDDEDLPLSV